RDFVLVRRAAGRYCLEFPSGNVIYATNGWISHARLSRNGRRIGFLNHHTYGDDAGSVAVIDGSGHMEVLSTGWGTMQGLAWSTDDEELWFAAAKENIDRSLFGVSLSGKLRSILYAPTPLGLQDISAAGDVLLTRVSHRRSMIIRFADDSRERDLSWLNW